jgi:hypothetical protein
VFVGAKHAISRLEPGRKPNLPPGLLSSYHVYMAKAFHVNTKTPKKRPSVTGDLVGVRVQPNLGQQIDDWRRKQDDLSAGLSTSG